MSLAAKWLDGAMKYSGISQAELAKRAKMSQQHLSKILSGKAGEPNLRTIERLIQACGCEIVELRVRKRPRLN